MTSYGVSNNRESENCQGNQDSDVLISVQVHALLYDAGITSYHIICTNVTCVKFIQTFISMYQF